MERRGEGLSISLPEEDSDLENRQEIIDQGLTNLIVELNGRYEFILEAPLTREQLDKTNELVGLNLNEISDEERRLIENWFGLQGEEPKREMISN